MIGHCIPGHSTFAIQNPLISFAKHDPRLLVGSFHICETVINLPISASIGNVCVKDPCQDTIAALWKCNVRPSIGTRRTMAALEEINITAMLISNYIAEHGEQRDETTDRKYPYCVCIYIKKMSSFFIHGGGRLFRIVSVCMSVHFLSGSHSETTTAFAGLPAARHLAQHMWVTACLNTW